MSVAPLLLGLAGEELRADEIAFIQRVKPAGFLLFGRNIRSAEQVKELTSHLVELSGAYVPLIAVDQEGGRVQRIKFEGKLPPASVFGEWFAYAPDEAMRMAFLSAFLLAAQLRNVGANWLLGPDLDLSFPETHAVIGNRAFSSDPAIVSVLGRAFMEGVAHGGCLSCLKHAPGHGRSVLDTHVDLPLVEASFEDLQQDMQPFADLAADCPFIMTAHIVFRAFGTSLPATFDSALLAHMRAAWNFKGLMIADDVGMNALSGRYDERLFKALNAGCDLVICSMSKLIHGMAGTVWDEDNFRVLEHAHFPDVNDRALQFIKQMQIPPAPTALAIAQARDEFMEIWSRRKVGLDINIT